MTRYSVCFQEDGEDIFSCHSTERIRAYLGALDKMRCHLEPEDLEEYRERMKQIFKED